MTEHGLSDGLLEDCGSRGTNWVVVYYRTVVTEHKLGNGLLQYCGDRGTNWVLVY